MQPQGFPNHSNNNPTIWPANQPTNQPTVRPTELPPLLGLRFVQPRRCPNDLPTPPFLASGPHSVQPWGCLNNPSPTPPFPALNLHQHSCSWQQAVLLPLPQTLLIVMSVIARRGCYLSKWLLRYPVEKGHRSEQMPEGGSCLPVVLHQSIHQSHVLMWGVTGFGGHSSLHTAAQPNCCRQAVQWGGLVSPPSGDIATSSPSREAPDEVDWVPSWR